MDFLEGQMLDAGFLRDYIAYAHKFVHPVISEAASVSLINKYLEMRRAGSQFGQVFFLLFQNVYHTIYILLEVKTYNFLDICLSTTT